MSETNATARPTDVVILAVLVFLFAAYEVYQGIVALTTDPGGGGVGPNDGGPSRDAPAPARGVPLCGFVHLGQESRALVGPRQPIRIGCDRLPVRAPAG